MQESEQIILITNEENSIELSIPPPGDMESFFVFSLHKSGSTLLNNVVRFLCKFNDIPFVNFPEQIFHQGLFMKDFEAYLPPHFKSKGYCYTGFRYVPESFRKFDFTKYPTILLIRDPRDTLVSLYFSALKSHNIPKGVVGDSMKKRREKLGSVSLEKFVLDNAVATLTKLKNLEILGDKNLRLYRYEDIIFNKKEWIKDIAGYLKLSITEEQINVILGKFDIIPKEENDASHIRQVTPGDHIRKLSPETISKLTEIFKEQLEKYGYV